MLFYMSIRGVHCISYFSQHESEILSLENKQ